MIGQLRQTFGLRHHSNNSTTGGRLTPRDEEIVLIDHSSADLSGHADGSMSESAPMGDEADTETPTIPGSEIELGTPVDAGANLVHETLKGLDISFGMQLAGLKRDALAYAHDLAARGLPRHDLEVSEPIEVERVLSREARQIYSRWRREACRRVEYAITRELGRMRSALTSAGTSQEGFRRVKEELQAINPRRRGFLSSVLPTRLPSVEEPSQPTKAPEPFPERASPASIAVPVMSPAPRAVTLAECRLRGWWFWPLMTTLVIAEFVANAPVFSELFPDRGFHVLADQSTETMWTAGLTYVAATVASHPDAAFLALSIVAFMLFLGHFLGGELRSFIVLIDGHPSVPEPVTARLRRQSRLTIGACLLGVSIATLVLYVARSKVENAAEERHGQAVLAAAEAEARLIEARGNLDEDVSTIRDHSYRTTDALERATLKLEYARSISRMNSSILGLNCVLLIVAVVAGFHRQKLTIPSEQTDATRFGPASASPPAISTEEIAPAAQRPPLDVLGGGIGPRVMALRERLGAHRSEMEARLLEAEHTYGRILQLAECNPLSELKGIASVLENPIDIFRTENARLRNLDTRDIKAFGAHHDWNLPQTSYQAPAELRDQISREFDRMKTLRSEYDRLTVAVRIDQREHKAQDGFAPLSVSPAGLS